MPEIIINHDNDSWRVTNTGAVRDGAVYCHLASTTRFQSQANGQNPVQIGDFIPFKTLQDAGYHHTYTLTNDGFISPSLMRAMRGRQHKVVSVDQPRAIDLDGLVLRLRG